MYDAAAGLSPIFPVITEGLLLDIYQYGMEFENEKFSNPSDVSQDAKERQIKESEFVLGK